MRQAIIISTTALLSALAALWLPTVIIANPQKPTVASGVGLVGVMQMMNDARDLPDQRYDAF